MTRSEKTLDRRQALAVMGTVSLSGILAACGDGNETVLTSQLFFDEDISSAVYSREPYSRHTGRDVLNDGDNIFDERLLTSTKKDGSGYLAVMTFDVQSA
jgi:hypothetical protein